MTVKIIELGKKVNEVALEDGSSVEQALKAAGLDPITTTSTINGKYVAGDHVLCNNDIILINVAKVTGNSMIDVDIVSVGTGTPLKTVSIEAGSSIEDIARKAGVDITERELRVNSSTETVKSDYVINNDSMVVVGKKIKGNN